MSAATTMKFEESQTLSLFLTWSGYWIYPFRYFLFLFGKWLFKWIWIQLFLNHKWSTLWSDSFGKAASASQRTLKSSLEPSTRRHINIALWSSHGHGVPILLFQIYLIFSCFSRAYNRPPDSLSNLLFLMTVLLCSKTLSILNEFAVKKMEYLTN